MAINKTQKISIVVPSFNEEGNIEVMIDALDFELQKIGLDYEIIFVDDGSKDNSLSLLKKLSIINKNLFFIELSRNFGHQNALMAGLDLATGDAIITMDGDMQHPPNLIPEMILKWQEGYDIVYTRRLEDKNLPFFKKITSKYFYKLINYISEIDIEQGTADFRLMDKKITKVFFTFSENELFIRGLVNWIGFKQYAIDYEPAERFSATANTLLKKCCNLV